MKGERPSVFRCVAHAAEQRHTETGEVPLSEVIPFCECVCVGGGGCGGPRMEKVIRAVDREKRRNTSPRGVAARRRDAEFWVAK